MEFFDISSQWKVNEQVNDEDFQGIILVPEVSFRVRNVSQRDLSYVFLLGVFRFMDTGKMIGEGYRMALRQPLPPGGSSERITLNAGFGYRATSATAFEKYQQNWRNSFCEIFAKSHNSGVRHAEDLLHQPPNRGAGRRSQYPLGRSLFQQLARSFP